MKILDWERLKKLRGLLATDQPEPTQQAERIVAMQRDVVFPAKAGVCLVVLSYLFFSGWLEEPSTRSVVLETLRRFFEIYLICTLVGALCFVAWRRLPSELFKWLAFTLGLLDGLFMAGLVIVTGGYDSIAFWVFPALIVLNAVSIPLAMPQIVLNVLLSIFYLVAVMLSQPFNSAQTVLSGTPGRAAPGLRGTNQIARLASGNLFSNGVAASNGINRLARPGGDMLIRTNRNIIPGNLFTDTPPDEVVTRQLLLLRVSVLWLLTLCCYGTQVLQERQREALREAVEFAAREAQLQSAGRLAAEFAHRIKNPLAIINNAAYSLRRSLRDQQGAAGQQIEIIQEEVARADKVITQIMGYAQLSEGRVEKLKVTEEIDRACDQVFPAAVSAGIRLSKHFAGPFPSLFMQRAHLAEILVNLLQNSREAMAGRGIVSVTAAYNRDQMVEIAVADDGPGIAPDKLERIFEAYFTTKEKGTGLGLAIVKHNVELYGGSVHAESVLGKGAKFTVTLPAKSQPKSISR